MGCRRTLGTIGVGIVLSGLTPADGRAQTRMSERATLSQMVSGAVIGLDYGRPQARGRIPFGERGQAVVRWGEVWTPGANWATTLELSRDATIEGTPVRKGKYSMWMAPARAANALFTAISEAVSPWCSTASKLTVGARQSCALAIAC